MKSPSCFNVIVDEEPMQLPIDGVMDLHTFQPCEVKSLVLEYLMECRVPGGGAGANDPRQRHRATAPNRSRHFGETSGRGFVPAGE